MNVGQFCDHKKRRVIIMIRFGEKIVNNPVLIDQLVSNFHREKKYLINKLNENSIKFIETESNFVLIDIKNEKPNLIQEKFKDKGILVAIKMKKYLRIIDSQHCLFPAIP